MKIPVAQPLLPTRHALWRYLGRIDRARYYSNGGPLVQELEGRLARHFRVAPECVVTTASGSAGLVAVLQGLQSVHGSLCLMPAWTFAASGQAVLMAGLTPLFVDVEPDTWMLSPDRARQVIREQKKKGRTIAAVMVVSPFGMPVNLREWASLTDDTGIPVVADCADMFSSLTPGPVPAVVSMHAMKILGCGEGGCVITTRRALGSRIRATANLGRDRTGQIAFAGANAKMSEYHAAVGLAHLSRLAAALRSFQRVARGYRAGLGGSDRVTLQRGYGERWVSATCVVRLVGAEAGRVARALRKEGIESRQWWRRGLHREPAFMDCPRTDLSVTDELAAATIGLPCYPDLPTAGIKRVCRALLAAVG